MNATHPIRIPPVTTEQRRAFLRAAGRAQLSLNAWILDTLVREARKIRKSRPGSETPQL